MSAARKTLLDAMHERRERRAQQCQTARLARLDANHARITTLLGRGWLTADQAARLLCCSPLTLFTSTAKPVLREAITHRSASARKGATPRGVGVLFLRTDVERVAAIRKRCHVGLAVACRIYSALKSGGPL